MRDLNIGLFVLYMIAFIFSLSAHEAAHAWASNYFGDDLARSQGRISLNPITHIDPLGTLIFPAFAFFTGAPTLGWARPTPINPARWRDYRRANFWVSIAGIIVNLGIAVIAGIIIRVTLASGLLFNPNTPDGGMTDGIETLLDVFFRLNIGLAVFNLLPIPPLDGSKILKTFLPSSFDSMFDSLDQYGFILLWIGVLTGFFGTIFGFVIPFAYSILLIGT